MIAINFFFVMVLVQKFFKLFSKMYIGASCTFLLGAEQSAPKGNCKNRKLGLQVLVIDST